MGLVRLERTKESFQDKISNQTAGSQHGIMMTIENFESFCMEKHGKANIIPDMKQFTEIEDVFDVLQAWINWNDSLSPSSVKIYFSRLKKYLHYMGIKLNDQDIKNELDFKHHVQEELYGLTLEDIQKIFKQLSYKNRVQFMCQMSGLMRIGEVVQIKKKNLILNHENIIVKIPASITKGKKARTTFFSKEASIMLRPRLRGLSDEDLVFGTHSEKYYAKQNSEQSLRRVLAKVGLDMRYESTDRFYINTHSFRAYGITKMSRHDPNFAKKLAGQKGYLLQYDRISDGEKLLSKTFTLDGIPATLPYAWITKIFGICSQIQMWYNPLDKDEAITRMVRFKNIIYDDAKNNRITSELYKRADDTENAIRKDSARLYEVIVNCTVVGDTRKLLKENVKTFKKHLKRYGGHFSVVSAKQAAMLLEGFGKKITFDRGSCAILYSFASADMLEIPDGIPLGINMDSKGPIIFDIGKRTNYNIAVIGKSGSGKSFTVKILLNRLLKKFPDSYVYVIDPMGEYSRIADYFGGMDVLYLKDEKDRLGLDPFVLLDPLDAADILAEITNAPDDVKRQFQTYCGQAKTFEEFFKLTPKKYKDTLINLKKGPLSRIISGKPKLNTGIRR